MNFLNNLYDTADILFLKKIWEQSNKPFKNCYLLKYFKNCNYEMQKIYCQILKKDYTTKSNLHQRSLLVFLVTTLKPDWVTTSMLQSGTLWMVLLGSNSVTCIQTHVTDAADTCTCPGGVARLGLGR